MPGKRLPTAPAKRTMMSRTSVRASYMTSADAYTLADKLYDLYSFFSARTPAMKQTSVRKMTCPHFSNKARSARLDSLPGALTQTVHHGRFSLLPLLSLLRISSHARLFNLPAARCFPVHSKKKQLSTLWCLQATFR